jgi:hypothetical protein
MCVIFNRKKIGLRKLHVDFSPLNLKFSSAKIYCLQKYGEMRQEQNDVNINSVWCRGFLNVELIYGIFKQEKKGAHDKRIFI